MKKLIIFLILSLWGITTQAQTRADSLRLAADTIRNETIKGANSAERIGRMFNSVINYADIFAAQRLDSLIDAGVGGAPTDYWKTSGTTSVTELTDISVGGLGGALTIGNPIGVQIVFNGRFGHLRVTENRTGINATGIQYTADYSANFTDRSLIDKGFAGTNYWKTSGNSTISSEVRIGSTYGEVVFDAANTSVSLHAKNGGFVDLYGGSVTDANNPYKGFYVDEGNLLGEGEVVMTNNSTGEITIDSASHVITIRAFSGSSIKLEGLPTASPCAIKGPNTIWNDAGVLKICP